MLGLKQFIFALVLLCTAHSFAFSKSASDTKLVSSTKVINNSWYIMQAGSTPWGFYHEVIEERDGRYTYRYEMTKREKGVLYQENIGAIAQTDLTPIAFNLNKAGSGATEVINGTYSADPSKSKSGVGTMNISVTGARSARLKRTLPKGTMLEVFVPIWLQKNWARLKPGSSGTIPVFTEDANVGEYISRSVRYQVKGMDSKDNCMQIQMELTGIQSLWCITSSGVLMTMDINNHQIQVRKANNEKEAKAALGMK